MARRKWPATFWPKDAAVVVSGHGTPYTLVGTVNNYDERTATYSFTDSENTTITLTRDEVLHINTDVEIPWEDDGTLDGHDRERIEAATLAFYKGTL